MKQRPLFLAALRWIFLSIIGTALLLALYLRSLKFENLATIPDVGITYALQEPALFLDSGGARERFAALGLMDPIRWLGQSFRKSSIAAPPSIGTVAFDPRAPIEDRQKRLSLPETMTIAGVTSMPGWKGLVRTFPADPKQFDTWTRANANIYSSKYSSANQIDAGNANRLQLAWSLDTSLAPGGKRREGLIEANPIFADGLLFSTTSQWTIVALEARSGKPVWSFSSPELVALRGMIYWPGDHGHGARLYAPIGSRIVALDAKTGHRIRSFGEDGFVRTGVSVVAPLIHKGVLLVAANRPPTSTLVGLDLVTGRSLWSVPLHPKDHAFEGGIVWGGMSLDPARNLVFLNTGNPRPASVGTGRPGDDRNSNSVVAVDIGARRIVWTFQETRHDLWDFDIPSPPVLTTIKIDGSPIDVVIAVTKIGNVIMLERQTGRPVFDFRLARVPASSVPGEVTAPYQPNPEIPESLMRMEFTPADISHVDPAATRDIQFQLENAIFGRYEPPAIGRKAVAFGASGGAQWPGAAVDPDRNMLYVPVNLAPTQIQLFLTSRGAAARPGGASSTLYSTMCESCHGAYRNGKYSENSESKTVFIPSLNGLSFQPFANKLFEKGYLLHRHQFSGARLPLNQAQLDDLKLFFSSWDAAATAAKDFHINYGWNFLRDQRGRPGSSPPWGGIIALDLTSGKRRWFAPIGQLDEKGQEIGTPQHGGVIATAGNVLFATGTSDALVRALDAGSGSVLWSYKMATAGSAPPTTFMVDGVQYVAVLATGYPGSGSKVSMLYAFKLAGPR